MVRSRNLLHVVGRQQRRRLLLPLWKSNLGIVFWFGATASLLPVVRSFSAVSSSASTVSPPPPSLVGTTIMSTTFISFEAAPAKSTTSTMVIGPKSVLQNLQTLKDKLDLSVDEETLQAVVEAAVDDSDTSSTYVQKHKLIIGVIPDKVSRNNHPWSVHAITEMVAKSVPGGGISRLVFVGKESLNYQGALALAVAKAFPIYSKKTTSASRKQDTAKLEEEKKKKSRTIHIEFWDETGTLQTPSPEATTVASAAVQGVQLAARLVDMPPEELTTDAYSAECRQLADTLDGVTMTEIVGEELNEKGYGGIYGVGKAATCPPRLVIMEYNPPSSESGEVVCLVGKSIVYDTGGLALKPKTGMCGMKRDMGGSAGVLGGFVSAVRSGLYKQKLVLLMCMAENAIGPKAFRNDDILTLYSGKCAEINNSDAEGRLVLGDGVAHATQHIADLDLVLDMATLTGAQMVCTGQKHAGILANQAELETRAMDAGLKSGDLVYPMLYAPELLMKEFKSSVADMKNSVKDRSNAQSSCAGHFIESHLDEDYKGGWLHVDMAGPCDNNERGTGYGVGLVLSLLGLPGF